MCFCHSRPANLKSNLNCIFVGHPTLRLCRHFPSTSFLFLHHPLNDRYEEGIGEWNQLSKDQPELNPLDVGGGGQLVEDADQQGGDGQHHGQVHGDGGVEELWQLEEDGDVAEDNQKERREEGVYRFNG